MWDDDYRMEQDDVKAPEFLKVKTLQKMSDSRRRRENVFKSKGMWSLAASFVIVVVVLNWANIFDSGPEPITDLVFERLDRGPLHFGVIDDHQDTTLTDAEFVIGVSISDLNLEDFHLENVAWLVEGNNVRIQYIFEHNNSSLRIMVNNHTDSVSTNSILNDLPLALYYQIMLLDITYFTEFLDNEIYYQIVATGLTEEEFVNYLKEIINFLN